MTGRPESGGGGLSVGFSPANTEIYVILRNNCLSMKFQFLLSKRPQYLEAFPAITATNYMYG